jgi:hypothetical protein
MVLQSRLTDRQWGGLCCIRRHTQRRGFFFLVHHGKDVWSRFGAHSATQRVEDAFVPIEPNYTPSHMVCPKCGKLMRLIAIEPSPSVTGADEIIYRCRFLLSRRKAYPKGGITQAIRHLPKQFDIGGVS